MSEAGFASPRQGLCIHERKHQHPPAHGIDGDCADQSLSIEARQESSTMLEIIGIGHRDKEPQTQIAAQPRHVAG